MPKRLEPLTLPEEFYVEVLPEDIARGRRSDCNKCPIALAALRHLKSINPKRLVRVEVTHDDLLVASVRGAEAHYEHDGRDFISAFDNKANAKASVVPVVVRVMYRNRIGGDDA